jgi:hypothetical protein
MQSTEKQQNHMVFHYSSRVSKLHPLGEIEYSNQTRAFSQNFNAFRSSVDLSSAESGYS